MPRSPSQRLIVGQAAFALTVFESALDPVALPLHLRQLEPGCIGGGVRETVFDRLDRSYLAPDDQMPASRSFFLTVPEPNPTVSDVDSQLSARAVAQEAARPVLGRDALGQFLDGDRLRDGLPLLRRPPAARLGRGNIESRLLGPNGCERNSHGGRGTLRKPPRSPPPTIRSAIIRAYGYLTNREFHFALQVATQL